MNLISPLSIGALAMDPSNSNVIYAGTGESEAGHLGNGIFKSADAGVTWTLLGKPAATGAFNYPVAGSQPRQLIALICGHARRRLLFAVWRKPDAAGTAACTNVFTTPRMRGNVIALAPPQPSSIYLAALLPAGSTNFIATDAV